MFRAEVITNQKHPCGSATRVGAGARQPVSRGERRGSGMHVTSAMPLSHVSFLFGRLSCVCFHCERTNMLLMTRLRKKTIKSKHHWKLQHLEPVIVSLWDSPWVSSHLGSQNINIVEDVSTLRAAKAALGTELEQGRLWGGARTPQSRNNEITDLP